MILYSSRVLFTVNFKDPNRLFQDCISLGCNPFIFMSLWGVRPSKDSGSQGHVFDIMDRTGHFMRFDFS